MPIVLLLGRPPIRTTYKWCLYYLRGLFMGYRALDNQRDGGLALHLALTLQTASAVPVSLQRGTYAILQFVITNDLNLLESC